MSSFILLAYSFASLRAALRLFIDLFNLLFQGLWLYYFNYPPTYLY